MNRRGLLVLVMLALAACAPGGLGAGEDEEAATTTTTTDETTTEPETTTTTFSGPPPEPPEVGECRGPISIEEITAPTDERPPVPCDQPHGTETVAVRDFPDRWDYDEMEDAVEGGDRMVEGLLDDCTGEVFEYIGEDTEEPEGTVEFNAHLIQLSFYVPTEDEWERGARWLRCDATLYPPEGADTDQPTATTITFAGAVAQPVIDPSLRQCATSPASEDLGEIPCTEPHSRELMVYVSDVDLDPTSVLREREWTDLAGPVARARCEAAVPARVGAERPDIIAQEVLPPLEFAIEEYEIFGAVTYQCWAVTSVPITGTVQAIGSNPLPPS